MCWVQPGGQDGPLFNYGVDGWGVHMWIVGGKFFIKIVTRSFQQLTGVRTAEDLPAGKWVHVAASYDHNTGINSLYINGRSSDWNNIGKGHEISTTALRVRMGTKGDKNQAYFKGKISRMRVYDVALYEAQIKTLIRQGRWNTIPVCTLPEIFVLPSPTIPLLMKVLGYWKTWQEVSDTRFRILFPKAMSRYKTNKWSIEPEKALKVCMYVPTLKVTRNLTDWMWW